MLKLTEHVGITISLLYKQKTRWNFDPPWLDVLQKIAWLEEG